MNIGKPTRHQRTPRINEHPVIPTVYSRAEENARYVDGFREDESFLGFKRESLVLATIPAGLVGAITQILRRGPAISLRDQFQTAPGSSTGHKECWRLRALGVH